MDNISGIVYEEQKYDRGNTVENQKILVQPMHGGIFKKIWNKLTTKQLTKNIQKIEQKIAKVDASIAINNDYLAKLPEKSKENSKIVSNDIVGNIEDSTKSYVNENLEHEIEKRKKLGLKRFKLIKKAKMKNIRGYWDNIDDKNINKSRLNELGVTAEDLSEFSRSDETAPKQPSFPFQVSSRTIENDPELSSSLKVQVEDELNRPFPIGPSEIEKAASATNAYSEEDLQNSQNEQLKNFVNQINEQKKNEALSNKVEDKEPEQPVKPVEPVIQSTTNPIDLAAGAEMVKAIEEKLNGYEALKQANFSLTEQNSNLIRENKAKDEAIKAANDKASATDDKYVEIAHKLDLAEQRISSYESTATENKTKIEKLEEALQKANDENTQMKESIDKKAAETGDIQKAYDKLLEENKANKQSLEELSGYKEKYEDAAPYKEMYEAAKPKIILAEQIVAKLQQLPGTLNQSTALATVEQQGGRSMVA